MSAEHPEELLGAVTGKQQPEDESHQRKRDLRKPSGSEHAIPRSSGLEPSDRRNRAIPKPLGVKKRDRLERAPGTPKSKFRSGASCYGRWRRRRFARECGHARSGTSVVGGPPPSSHNSRTTPAVPRIPGVQGAPRAPCAWMFAGYFVRPPLRWQSPAGDLLVPRAPADGRRRRSSSSRRKISRGNKVYLGIPSPRHKRPLFSKRHARVSAGCP